MCRARSGSEVVGQLDGYLYASWESATDVSGSRLLMRTEGFMVITCRALRLRVCTAGLVGSFLELRIWMRWDVVLVSSKSNRMGKLHPSQYLSKVDRSSRCSQRLRLQPTLRISSPPRPSTHLVYINKRHRDQSKSLCEGSRRLAVLPAAAPRSNVCNAAELLTRLIGHPAS